MSMYYNAQGEVREISDGLYAAWIAAGNPKAQEWTLRPEAPYASGCSWDGAQWVVTPDAAVRAEIVARIKQSAGDHILATMPMWRQSNMHGRNAELSLIKESRPLTEQELAERAAMLTVWTWAKSVRAASDAAEAALAGMTRAELDNWTEPTWPVFGA